MFKYLVFLFFGLSLCLNYVSAYKFELNSGLMDSAGEDGAGYYDVLPSTYTPVEIVSLVITIGLSLLGVIFLILMIYGGFLWMTAAGDEGKVDSAKSIIKNSIIGMIIVVAAYAISYFVISKLALYVLDK